MMSRMMKTTPPPTAAFMLPPEPGPGGEPPGRARKPSRPEIFCCSFLRISSRSGGPSLFFFPHWGSFGGIVNFFGRGRLLKSGASVPDSSGAGHRARGVPSGLCEHFAKRLDSGTGERTHLDIQYLTMGIADNFG